MTVSIAALQAEMEAAAAALDFETAGRLRDRISLLRSGGDADSDPAGLDRQQPGAMGLGTSRQRVAPPDGWVKPKKPDPMTRGRGR
ncbi:UvrB/UvrC motif-containing protein [Sphingomonas sp. CLY1604]|uniref:UvrB/UvrC motif-containing protein n=1 Tax=Sphingomonas sp. CLY1604 TaxID=3457786 RepID=UPI003FD7D2E8